MATPNKLANFPTETQLRFASNHPNKINARLRKFLEIPPKERQTLRFARGSRLPMNRMSMNNLRLLHKHRHLFPKDAEEIREALLIKEHPGRFQRLENKIAQLPRNVRARLHHIPFNTTPLNKLSLNNIKFLHTHRNIFSNEMATRIHAEHVKRTDPLTPEIRKIIQNVGNSARKHLRSEESKRFKASVANATKTQIKQAQWELRAGTGGFKYNVNISPAPPPYRLNWNSPKPQFISALQFKTINNANVQNVIQKLKQYRNEHHPTKNNMPAKPVSSRLTSENRRKYAQNMREYNTAIREWIHYMANLRRQNKKK
jgi:hypothetical protein